jgi:hypothetical protein
MPLYLLSVCYPAGSVQPEPDALRSIMAATEQVRAALVDEGRWVFGGGLADASSSTTVVAGPDDAVVTDGPFIEAKEQIGGFSVIDAADLDEAIAWAHRMSAATTTPIEVRPFVHSSAG